MKFQYQDKSDQHWSRHSWHTPCSDMMKMTCYLCHALWHNEANMPSLTHSLTRYLTCTLICSLTCYLTHALTHSLISSLTRALTRSLIRCLWHILSDTFSLTCSLICCLWHIFSDRFSLTGSLWHVLSDRFSLTRSLWHVLSDTFSLTRSLWHVLSDTFSLTHSLWHVLSDTFSLTRSLWHILSDTFSLTLQCTQTQRKSDKKQSLWQYMEICLCSPPPIFSAHFSVYKFATRTQLFNWSVWEIFLTWGMSNEILYSCDRVLIPARSRFCFNIHRTLLPSANKSIHWFHAHNQLIELVRVFGIGVGYNESSFEDVVELHFTLIDIHNWMTKLP